MQVFVRYMQVFVPAYNVQVFVRYNFSICFKLNVCPLQVKKQWTVDLLFASVVPRSIATNAI